MVNVDYDVVCAQSDEAVWKAARWDGWSASVLPQLMTGFYPKEFPDKYATPLRELVSNHARRINTVEDNPYMEFGRRGERVMLDWAGDIIGRPMHSWGELLRSKHTPIILATPDGYIDGQQKGRVGDTLVEVKTHAPPARKGVKHYVWGDGVPAKVLVQVQTQLYVTGLQKAVVVEWSYPGPPLIHEIARDEAMIAKILDVSIRTWSIVESLRKRECL